MQYIQLQGQVAADLDLPLEGSYNLFIDTSDNSIKAKDSEGNLSGGGGISLVEVTRYEVDQLVLSSSLTPGAFYKIVGVASRSFYDDREWDYQGMGNEIQDGGSTIILQATSDKTLSKKGVGLFYVPNYEDPDNPTVAPDHNYLVWDNVSRLNMSSSFGFFDHDEYVNLYANDSSSNSYIRANIGLNSISLITPDNEDFFTNLSNYPMSIEGIDSNAWAGVSEPIVTASYSIGDKVIWGGRVWQNTTGNVGYNTGYWPMSQLHLNSEDWTVVAFNETDYTIVADIIEYEFEWDNISYRKTKDNVEVKCNYKIWDDNWGYNTMKYFPWGHYQTSNISINNSYLDAFINYPHDAWASEITFKDYGGFNAHYWGRETEIWGIDGDYGAHMVSLNLGYKTNINTIKIGTDSYIADIYTYDNDDYTDSFTNIELGIDCGITGDGGPIYMYINSYMDNIILEGSSQITDINLYPGSSIRDTKLGINSYIDTIALGTDSDFRQVEIGNSSYIATINTDDSACFKRVKMGTDCYISYIGIGINGYFKHIEMSDQSQIYCVGVGDYAYFEYVNLGINAEIYYINQYNNSYFNYVNVGIDSSINGIILGSDCYFSEINLEHDSTINDIDAGEAVDAYVQNITILNNVYFGGIDMQDGSSVSNMQFGVNSESGTITLTGGTSINNFEIGQNCGFGGLNLLNSSSLSNFEIGQNLGFSGMTISESLNNKTISREFSNLLNVYSQSLDATAGDSGYPLIDFSERSVINIDISGATTDVNFELPEGDWEGQELIFSVSTDGSHTIGPDQINVWSNRMIASGYGYPLSVVSGASTFLAFRPFARLDTSAVPTLWRNLTRAIWTGGGWSTDAEVFND